MKKFLALLVSVAMVFGLIAVPVAADGEVSFTVGTVSGVNPGESVSVPLTIGGADYEAHSILFKVHYDPEQLTVTSVNPGPAFMNRPWDSSPVINTDTPGVIRVGLICPNDGMTEHGVFLNMNFEVSATCTEDQELEFEMIDFFYFPSTATSKVDLPYIAENGLIDIVEPIIVAQFICFATPPTTKTSIASCILD